MKHLLRIEDALILVCSYSVALTESVFELRAASTRRTAIRRLSHRVLAFQVVISLQ